MASSQVTVNRHGFRGDPIDERKPPRTFRIFTLGGSTTMGVGTRYEDTYPFKLQAIATGMRMFNRAAQAIAESKRVPFLDFEGAVPKTRAYFVDDFHLTGPGNEILARMVFDWIVDQALIGAARADVKP